MKTADIIDKLETMALGANLVFEDDPKKRTVSIVIDRDDMRAVKHAIAALKNLP